MFRLLSFPTANELYRYELATPDYMRPNQLPFAVVGEAFLDGEACQLLIDYCEEEEPYTFPKCGAKTREFLHPLDKVFNEAVSFAKGLNDLFWEYDLDKEVVAWMQTYEQGSEYKIHADTRPGQMRKLTAIVMLSHPAHYDGGDLEIYGDPTTTFVPPQTRGTIVVFQPWLFHHVLPVTGGIRQTINLGFWGPNFK